MGKWCLHASSFIFDQIVIKVAGNQDRHKSSDEFDFGSLVSMAHLYVFEMRFDLGTLDSGERSLPFGLLVSISHSNVIYIGKFVTNISQELLHIEFCNLVQMLWIICCFMWKRTSLLLIFLPLISSFFFLSKFLILDNFISLFSGTEGPTKLKLGPHMGSRLVFHVYLNQAAGAYLFFYFFNFLSLKFQNIKFFVTLFCEAFKVETWYTYWLWVDPLHTPNTCSQNVLVSLFSFFLSFQLAKIKNLHRSTKLFQHTSDGYGRGYVSFAHYLPYYPSAFMPRGI